MSKSLKKVRWNDDVQVREYVCENTFKFKVGRKTSKTLNLHELTIYINIVERFLFLQIRKSYAKKLAIKLSALYSEYNVMDIWVLIEEKTNEYIKKRIICKYG